MPGFWLATVGEPGKRGVAGARGERGERGPTGLSGATIRDWKIDRARYVSNARDVGRPRGPAARIARAVRAIFARDEIVAIRSLCEPVRAAATWIARLLRGYIRFASKADGQQKTAAQDVLLFTLLSILLHRLNVLPTAKFPVFLAPPI